MFPVGKVGPEVVELAAVPFEAPTTLRGVAVVPIAHKIDKFSHDQLYACIT
jgi:hypothetical protein